MAVTSSANIVPSPAPPTQVTVGILPKPGLSPAKCERLGVAVRQALAELDATENCECNYSAVADLLAGEMPKSMVMRLMARYRPAVPIAASAVAKETKNRFGASDPWAAICDAPAVFITIAGDEGETDSRLSARIAVMLPPNSIQEVRVLSYRRSQQ